MEYFHFEEANLNFRTPKSGANPTIASYNTSAVKIPHVASSLAHFEAKMFFFLL
jgi:hypothetical protein